MPDARFDSALNLHRAGRLDEAEAGYRACLRDGVAEAASPLAALLLQRQRYDEALQLLEPLAAAAPENADVAANLSIALRQQGRLEEALQVAQRACASASAPMAAWNALGLSALDLGRLEEALAAFDAGLRLAPDQVALLLHRAHALRRLQRNEEAVAAYSLIVRSHPRVPAAWRGLAQVQAALGHAEAALHSWEQALQLAPGDRDLVFEHAVALLQLERNAEAAQRLQAALREWPDNAQAWMWLALAQLHLGELETARRTVERALALDHDDAGIRHFHAAIRGEIPDAVESDYIRGLFDDFAQKFEDTLTERLHYALPARLVDFLRRHRAEDADDVLDLGCGTGLMAERLARAGRRIDGVDLSSRMLERARAKQLYRELHAAELTAFLQASSATWELIVAADVFIYVADLRIIHAAAFARLSRGGCYAFSIERSAGGGTELSPVTGRYAHSLDQVGRELSAAGFVDLVSEAVELRIESNQPVVGELFLARRPS